MESEGLATNNSDKHKNIEKKEDIWRFTFPESSFVRPPYKIEGTMSEARESFYEFAKTRIRYLDHQQFVDYVSQCYEDKSVIEFTSRKKGITIIHFEKNEDRSEKLVTNFEILIDKSAFDINGEGFEDIIPFVVEHEMTESWARLKRGINDVDDWNALPVEEMTKRHQMGHRLAIRKEFLLAVQSGKDDKLFRWHMAINPRDENLYRQSWDNAKKKIRKK